MHTRLRYQHRSIALSGEIFRGSDAVHEGALSRDELRKPPWRRLFRNVYIDASELDPAHIPHNILCHAAYLLMPTYAIFIGKSAACLHGVDVADSHNPVEVLIPISHRYGPIKGIKFAHGTFGPPDTVKIEGLPTATPLFTAVETARRQKASEAVVVIDALAHRGLISQAELLARVSRKSPRPRGYTKALSAVSLMDARAESPQESRLRVRLASHDLMPEEAQFEIYNNERFVARVDFAWPKAKLALEYDGEYHYEPSQQRRDFRREQNIIACGWTVIRVNAARMRDGFNDVVREIKATLAS